MKRVAFLLKIAMYLTAFGGCILGAAGSVPLGINNAQWDYYNNSHRQLAGWLLCFAPMVIAFFAAAAYFILNRKMKVRVSCLITTVVCALFPPAYMLFFGHFSFFNLLSACLLFGFVLISLTVRALVHENVIAEPEEAEELTLLTESEYNNEGV